MHIFLDPVYLINHMRDRNYCRKWKKNVLKRNGVFDYKLLTAR